MSGAPRGTAVIPTTRGRPLPLWLELGAAAAIGAAQTLAFTQTALWLLPLLAIGALVWRLALAAPKRAAWLGFVFALAWLTASIWWLFISMHRYGGLPAWMAAAAVLALCAFMALPMAAVGAGFARWRSGTPLRDAALFAALWLLAEWLRGTIFTGFPWAASGYAQVDAPFARLAPWLGVYGVGAVAAGLAAWAALSLAHPARRFGGVAVAVVATVLLAALPALNFTRPSGTLSVALLQGNIPQEEKFAQAHQTAALEWHVSMLLAAQADLVVAPETAVPFLPQQMPPEFWPALKQHFSSGRTHALFGVPLGGEEKGEDKGYTNSAVGFSPVSAPDAATEYRYAKHHLVPFGEFIPSGFKWFTRMMNIPLGDFDRGALSQPSFKVRGERVAPNICYEDLFGEELAARFVDAAQAPTLFANLSNIGWFGESIAVDQHLHISRMRALEFERPMLRATNTGATAVIDHLGVVRHWQPPHTRGVLTGTVQGRNGLTPFAWWAARFGSAPLAILGVAAVWLLRARGRP